LRTGDYWISLFRLTPNQDYGNADYIGDRDLAIWLSWPNNALLTATSNYNSDDWNWYNWFPAENKNNILEKWFWVYMGYSWAQ